jgi:lysophospholipase L1-like esterase
MSVKEPKAYPETGWGMPFTAFFDETVTVENHALNGRSTKTFLGENRWQPVAAKLQKGDYVFIQFGHNDEVKTKQSYATEQEYLQNLRRFIKESRKQKAIPILITPVARRKFDTAGKLEDTHAVYSGLVRQLAKKEKVCLIDLDQKSQELLQAWGPETSRLLFVQLKPGEHPNYPAGKEDNTHFNELGAREMAQLVLAEIRNLKLELANRIVVPAPKK